MTTLNFLHYIFNPANFEAHGTHFVNAPVLFWVFVIANLVTFLAYVLIPIALVYFVSKKKDLAFHWVFLFFGGFIILCGIHHLLHTITFWYPIYGIEAVDDILTAIVSIGTFFSLLQVLPTAIQLRGPQELEEMNTRLSLEINNSKKTELQLQQKNQDFEQLNAKLLEKNEELEKLNKLMVGRELRMVELKNEIESKKSQRDSTKTTNG